MKMRRWVGSLLVVAFAAASTNALAAPKQAPCCTLTSPLGSSSAVAWSWGASNAVISGGGGGSGVGKPSFQDFSLTRNVDGQSPQYVHALATGVHLPTVVLVDGSTTITLTNALVTSYSTGGAGPDALTETITFTFGSLKYTVNGVTTCVGTCTQ